MRAGRLGAFISCAIFACAALGSGLDRMAEVQASPAWTAGGPVHARQDLWRATKAVRDADDSAIAVAMRAVRSNPASGRALTLLGAAYAQAGQQPDAHAAFLVAARTGWRDPLTQAYLYEAALETGDYISASRRADALLRTEPRAVSAARLLSPLEASGQGRKALAARLAGNPPWRSAYLAMNDLGDGDAARMRGTALARSGLPLSCEEASSAARALVDRGHQGQARQLWQSHCDITSTGAIADADWAGLARTLEHGTKPSPFGWKTYPAADIVMTVATLANGKQAIRLSGSATVSRPMLAQPVTLTPGLYRVTIATRASGRLALSLSCGIEPRRPSLTEGDVALDGQLIVAPGCDTQILSIWLMPGTGDVMLGPLRIKPVAG